MQHKVANSLGWSAIGEFGAKLIGPISTLILARLLTPEDFGILAICNMVLFFFDIIVDSGFGKYLVQREFKSNEEIKSYADVAFWTSVGSAIIVWSGIYLCRHIIGNFLGKPEYGDIIAIFSIQMILVTAVSTPLSLMRREFQFKKLAAFRIITSSIPLLVTVPLAMVTHSYWALIIGSFAGHISQGVMMLAFQKWRPSLSWSYGKLKEMIGFSFWSMCEGMAHWLIFWIDTFILTKIYSSYYVGLYKNSSSLVMSVYLLVATSIVPVLFSTLSRIKNNEESYSILLSVLRLAALILFPLTVLIIFNRESLTLIMLGPQWSEAAYIIASWALIMCFNIVIYSFPAEAFKAKGRPKLLFFYQLAFLSVMVPVCYYYASIGFWSFVNARTACIVVQFLLFCIFVKRFLRWSLKRYIKTIITPIFQALALALIFYCYKTTFSYSTIRSEYLGLIFSIITYLILLYMNRVVIQKTLKELR